MEKYKICPSCHTKNDPTLLECISCETDLTRVKVTDEETETAHTATEQEQPHAKNSMIRLCECGVKNPPNARKCSICGEDISDITPTADVHGEEKNTAYFVLSSIDGQYAFSITESSVTIGRECGMSEYLSSKPYVSRFHAVITIADNCLFIENLSLTNRTYVNNQKIVEKTKLHDGDEIGLGGMSINGSRQNDAAFFLVRIGQCM